MKLCKEICFKDECKNNTGNTNKVSRKKKWNVVVVQVNVEPPPIPLVKGKYNGKSDKYFVKLELCRDLMSEKSYPYELKTALSKMVIQKSFSCLLLTSI